MISFAPGAMVTSPVNSCRPAHVSVPVIVPLVVSLDAAALLAGIVTESTMLSRNSPVRERDRSFSTRAMYPRASSNQFNNRDCSIRVLLM